MKTPYKALALAVAMGGAVWLTSAIAIKADTGTASDPGSVDDPIVTKSYVDQQVKALVQQEIAKLPTGGTGTGTGVTSTVVQLKAGQTLLASAGTQLFVRTGTTVAVDTTGDGIPDLTDGKAVTTGVTIKNDHLLFFPKDKDRGIKPAANSAEVWVVVIGNYTIQ